VHDARLGSSKQQQLLLACLDGSSNSMLRPLSEVTTAGLQHQRVADVSSLLQSQAAAMHHLGLLCAALAACVQFWFQQMASDVQAGNAATLVRMNTQIASSGVCLSRTCGTFHIGRAHFFTWALLSYITCAQHLLSWLWQQMVRKASMASGVCSAFAVTHLRL
jgi:hypothetical protein